MHAEYQTIRLDSLIIMQKSVLKFVASWRSYGKKNCQKIAKKFGAIRAPIENRNPRQFLRPCYIG